MDVIRERFSEEGMIDLDEVGECAREEEVVLGGDAAGASVSEEPGLYATGGGVAAGGVLAEAGPVSGRAGWPFCCCAPRADGKWGSRSPPDEEMSGPLIRCPFTRRSRLPEPTTWIHVSWCALSALIEVEKVACRPAFSPRIQLPESGSCSKRGFRSTQPM
jgi:hypothetical protein